LDTFLDEAVDGVEAGKNEVGVGYGQVAFETWRGAFGLFLERYHVEG
jgi:hypothetical protein